MSVTLDSLYKPVHDFFIKKFQTANESPVIFRFDKFGSKISDEQFVENADEEFSDFVNRIPYEEPDGESIIFTEKRINESYRFEALSPSLPFVPAGADTAVSEKTKTTFSEIRATAIQKYDQKGWMARNGTIDDFWISYASPSAWYDRNNHEIWDHFSFLVNDPTSTPVGKSAKAQLWKVRLSDDQLQSIVPGLKAVKTTQPSDLQKLVLKKSVPPAIKKVGAFSIVKPSQVSKGGSPTRTNFHNAFTKLSLVNKIAVANYIKENAPTSAVTSNNISISFDFCVVSIQRRWLFDVFLDNNDWYIPGCTKGQLSNGGNLSVLPVGFVAVKNLEIKANWTTADREIAAVATDFGPFQINAQLNESGAVGHEGIQVIGWMIRRMPVLPPNNPPQ